MHYGWSFGCLFERHGKPYHTDYAAMARSFGARGVAIESADELYPALVEALRVEASDRDSGADGERADTDAGPLGHQRRLSSRRLRRLRWDTGTHG